MVVLETVVNVVVAADEVGVLPTEALLIMGVLDVAPIEEMVVVRLFVVELAGVIELEDETASESTDTVLFWEFATYTSPCAASKAAPYGCPPTVGFAITLLVLSEMTETVFDW